MRCCGFSAVNASRESVGKNVCAAVAFMLVDTSRETVEKNKVIIFKINYSCVHLESQICNLRFVNAYDDRTFAIDSAAHAFACIQS